MLPTDRTSFRPIYTVTNPDGIALPKNEEGKSVDLEGNVFPTDESGQPVGVSGSPLPTDYYGRYGMKKKYIQMQKLIYFLNSLNMASKIIFVYNF